MLPKVWPFEQFFGLEVAFRYLDISSYEDESHHRYYILSLSRNDVVVKTAYFCRSGSQNKFHPLIGGIQDSLAAVTQGSHFPNQWL